VKRLVALLCLIVLSPGYVDTAIIVQTTAAAATCNEFTDDFSAATLANWSYDSGFSLDTTNDELDATGTSLDAGAVYNADSATDHDMFVKVQVVDADSLYGTGLVLRSTNRTNGTYAYIVYDYNGDLFWGRAQWVTAENRLNWSCDVTSTAFSGLIDGDVFAAAVSGTGASTEMKIWINPDSGNCPADWGTADYTWTDCTPSCCVDNTTGYVYGGVQTWPQNGARLFSWDNFVGGDN